MDCYLNRHWRTAIAPNGRSFDFSLRRVICMLALFGGILPVGTAPATENLPDPTRPPAYAASDAADGTTNGAGEQRLTSVLLPKDRRPLAIIGGQIVHIGSKVGEAELVSIAENGALLAGPEGKIWLSLTPAAHKKIDNTALRRTNG